MEENEPIKKEETAAKTPKKGNREKIILIIIISLLVIGILVFVYFKYFKQTDKKIVFYRYQDKLFIKDPKYYRTRYYYKDIDTSKLKEYTYNCKYDYCEVFDLEYQNSMFDDSIDGNWVLIYDLNKKSKETISSCINEDGKYVLYNVETEKKYLIPLAKNYCITDIYVNNDGEAKGLIATEYGSAKNRFLFDVETGDLIIDTDNLIVCNESSYRDLSVVNNGKQNFYVLKSKYYNHLIYDQNFNYINDIDSKDCFDDEGNIIKIINDDKTNKKHFNVYDLQGKVIYTSKTYDSLEASSGYLISINNGIVNIINSREKVMIEISKNGKKYDYSVYANKYFGKDGLVSIFEFQDPNSDINKVTQYIYNPTDGKLNKENVNFDGISAANALSVYFSNGYTKYKVSNTTVYLDNELTESKKSELKKFVDDLSNEKITKKLLTAKQNIYLFTEYDYSQYHWKAFANGIYSPLSIAVDDTISIGEIVRLLGINYYNSNSKKLHNAAFEKLYNQYYSYFDEGYVHAVNDTYYEEGFFGVLISSYFNQENSLSIYSMDSDTSITRNKLQTDNKIDKFDEAVKKYVENYVLK